MTTNLRNATLIRLAMLACALAFAAGLLALACGPSAPSGQDGGAAEATATPEPTSQAEPTETPTPEPTATATATPTSTSEPSSGQNQAPMDAITSAWVAGAQARQSTPGAPGQSTPERTIAVQLFVGSAEDRTAIIKLLESNGIAHSRVEGPLNRYDIRATVPISMLARLAAHRSVGEIMAIPHPYRNLSTHLNVLAAKYEAGLLPDEDANPTYAQLVVEIEGGDANYDAVKRYLENNGAIMTFAERDMAELFKPSLLVAFTPISKLVALAGMAGVVYVSDEGYPVPETLRFTTPSIFDEPAETPTPTTTAQTTGFPRKRE